MSGHTAWQGVPVTREVLEEMIAYHQGYVLALQDILDDYSRMMRSGTYTRQRMADTIKSSLSQAQRSLGRIVSEKDRNDT